MSIEKIKERLKAMKDLKVGYIGLDKVLCELNESEKLLESIAEYLIEQHEQKEAICNTPPHDDRVECDPVVEVGQVWRSKEDGEKIKLSSQSVIDSNEFLAVFSDGEEYIIMEQELRSDFELVNMENIREGEWVECVKTTCHKKGDKIKVKKVNGYGEGLIMFEDLTVQYAVNYKPCIPPTAQQKQEEDYLEKYELLMCEYQSDVDKAKEEGYIEGINKGNEIINQQRKLIETYKTQITSLNNSILTWKQKNQDKHKKLEKLTKIIND